MMIDKLPFGRNLSSMLSNLDEDDADFALEEAATARDQHESPIENLFPNPDQPRRHFSEEGLAELAKSITRNGILQPILVRPHPFKAEAFEIVAGERRWQAAQKIGLLNVPIIVKNLNDADTIEIALIENIHRQDLNPIEEGAGYKQLIEEFDYTQEQLAEVVSRSRSHIANLMRLLSLPQSVKALLVSGEISSGHARTLVGLEKAEAIARYIVQQALSVRQTEHLTQAMQNNPHLRPEQALENTPKAHITKPSTASSKDSNITVLQQQLTEKLGLKIAIRTGKKRQSGSLTIHYKNLEEFDRIRQILEQMA